MTVAKAWRQVRLLTATFDVAGLLAAYVAGDFLRTRLWMNQPWPERLPGLGSAFQVHYWTLLVLPLAWVVVLHWHRWYEPGGHRLRWYLRRAVTASAVTGLLTAGLALFLQREAFPRMQVVAFTALLPATTLIARGISSLLAAWLASGHERRVLIVGLGREAVRLRRLLRASTLGRCNVLGHLAMRGEHHGPEQRTGAVLGGVERLAELLDTSVVDEVFFAVRIERLPEVLPYVRLCEEVGVVAHVLAESMVCHAAPEVVEFHGVPMLAYAPVRHSAELLFIKRVLDVILAAVGIVASSPIMLLCAVLIRFTSPGPILFRQRRSGLHGRAFTMYKFRTMHADADRRLDEVAHLNEADGPVFKSRVDPRVTRMGAWLRRYSLDELPQLFNVLIGDMSIVGPRPPLPEEVARYDRWQRRRLSMRPGLTCLWQVKGRHRVGFDEWMHLDLFYIDHWSLRLDFLIMCRTVPVVLSGTGL